MYYSAPKREDSRFSIFRPLTPSKVQGWSMEHQRKRSACVETARNKVKESLNGYHSEWGWCKLYTSWHCAEMWVAENVLYVAYPNQTFPHISYRISHHTTSAMWHSNPVELSRLQSASLRSWNASWDTSPVTNSGAWQRFCAWKGFSATRNFKK